MHSRKPVTILLFSLWILFGLVEVTQAADAEDELRARIQQLEERLRRIEQGQESATERGDQTVDVEELRRQVDILASEVEKLRSGETPVELSEEETRALGLAPSAAATYRRRQGVSIAGYGEMLYENFDDENESGLPAGGSSRLDFLRQIIYLGYRFNDKFVFNSEIELEHANEISVEFAYVDYLATDYLTLRAGMLLMPMGLINEFHEPTVFLGARRTETEQRIIPSTWRENGFGVVGSAGMFNYRAYLVNGFDASGFSSDGLRGGRQKGSKAKASDVAFVGRLDVTPTPGVFFGGSLYVGDSGQGQFQTDGEEFGIRTVIGEVHSQVQIRGFDVRGLYARASLDDVAELNSALDLSAQNSIGETLQGGYIQFGYNVLSQVTEQVRLTPYYRFEKLNTQDEVPLGFEVNPARDRTFHTLGFEFRPLSGITVKTDYQWIRNEAESGLNQFNVALGYNF